MVVVYALVLVSADVASGIAAMGEDYDGVSVGIGVFGGFVC